MSTASLQDTRALLLEHFKSDPNSPKRWDDLWKEGVVPWDRAKPNPALVDILKSRKDLIGEPFVTTGSGARHRKKAFVPGCGRGYDVLLLASFGYDAVGLDGSETAITECKKLEATEGDKYPLQEGLDEKGSVEFLLGDFFKDDWAAGYNVLAEENGFDLIYDYTFLSALPPSTRPQWALRMVNLLAPAGSLICLEFPTTKPPSTGGPPWALPPVVYEQHLSRPGEDLKYNEEGHIVIEDGQTKNDKALVRLAHWMPERTHEIGKGADWVSIWRHSRSS